MDHYRLFLRRKVSRYSVSGIRFLTTSSSMRFSYWMEYEREATRVRDPGDRRRYGIVAAACSTAVSEAPVLEFSFQARLRRFRFAPRRSLKVSELSDTSRTGPSHSIGNGDRTKPTSFLDWPKSWCGTMSKSSSRVERPPQRRSKIQPRASRSSWPSSATRSQLDLFNSLAHPGGNATGFSIVAPELAESGLSC